MCNRKKSIITLLAGSLLLTSCMIPKLQPRNENKKLPEQFAGSSDTTNSAQQNWKLFFRDTNLIALIDTALKYNQDLNIMLQEINIARNEIRARKGEYLPFLNLGAAAGTEKSGRFTSKGANDATTDIMPGTKTPDPLQDYLLGTNLSWEVDIWKKLRNAKKSAVYRYLATEDGKNFMLTHLISEIATSYYELLALDNQLDILRQNIGIQTNALEIVKLEKISAKVTELAVRKFEAEVLKNQSRQYEILQKITETENRINFLVGRLPQHITRNASGFISSPPPQVLTGIPSQLLQNRTDIKKAEHELAAARLDLKVAKAQFYPSFMIRAGLGYQAFNPVYLFQSPQSLVYNLAGELVAPLINRNAIKAAYYNAGSRQLQAVFNYERSVLNAYMEVSNQLAKINNLRSSYELKEKQVEALTHSIDISTILFKSARADYMEVLMTQRDALESRFELVETRKQQLNTAVSIYQALGGGWK
ncbi:MAG TPA: efflux transporter outer membrane subunit [Bacteroidia bacterium]|nr:efflux transporter outer membrane subunit [Bacteroidia bacterium]